MKYKSLTILCFILNGLPSFLQAQSPKFGWARQFGGAVDNDLTTAITGDKKGNIYSVGSFWGTADFDPTANTYNRLSQGAGDIFINAQDSAGKHMWTVTIGGQKSEIAHDVTVDDQNSMYVVGQYQGPTDFNPSEGRFTVSSKGQYDGFICKLGLQTGFAWMVRIGSLEDVAVKSVAVNKAGDVFVTGFLYGTVNFATNEGGKEFVTSNGKGDAFVAKYSSAGQFKWARQFGGTDNDIGTSIAVDQDGNAYATGYFRETIDMDTLKPGSKLISKGETDFYVVKLDSMGNTKWAKQIGGPDLEVSTDLQINSKGDIVCTGQYVGNTDFDPSSKTVTIPSKSGGDIFVLKLTGNGDYTWVKQMGGYRSDISNAVALDEFDNIYTTGRFSRTADFDPGPNEFNLTSNFNSTDIFVSKLNTNGEFTWAINLGSSSNAEEGTDIYVDVHRDLYTAGYFSGLVDFDHSLASTDLTSAGLSDGYLHKLNQCLDYTFDEINTCRSYTWLDGNTYTQSNNTATLFFSSDSAHECDRLVTLNLTIDEFNKGVDLSGSILTAKETDASFQWVNCDSNYKSIEGATGLTFFVKQKGSYAVVMSKNNCSDTSDCVNVTSLSNQKWELVDVLIYPNPVNEQLSIQLPNKLVNRVVLTSLTGSVIMEYNDDLQNIDVSGLKSGLYLLRVYAGDEVYTARFVKE